MAQRRQNFQNISWFWDNMQRGRLNLEPPYQRRSVWSPRYRQQFIDTILMNYPAPAIFLFSRIDESGVTTFELVDGKQRLTTIFDFLKDEIAVSDDCPLTNARGQYFSALPSDMRVAFYEYDFSVEYLPTNNEEVINNIFDRLNRNVAKLTPQELRHAQFDGLFIGTAEQLADWMKPDFDQNFPRIAEASRRQMKDVEFIATLLLLLEEGPRAYTLAALDRAFSDRDEEWEQQAEVEDEFRSLISYLRPQKTALNQTRFRNQADYYSLIGALADLRRANSLPDLDAAVSTLTAFGSQVDDEEVRENNPTVQEYYDAARSASNDAGPRGKRIEIVRDLLSSTT